MSEAEEIDISDMSPAGGERYRIMVKELQKARGEREQLRAALAAAHVALGLAKP